MIINVANTDIQRIYNIDTQRFNKKVNVKNKNAVNIV
jgi:hypothetical protein